MIKVKLLQDYQDNNKGDIIEVTNNVAFGLEDRGIAKKTTAKDFVKKTKLGATKAFGTAPSEKSFKKNNY